MGGEQMQHKMLDQLFAAYFEEERDIGCFDSLSNAAVKAGVFPTHPDVSDMPILTPYFLLHELNVLFPSSQPCTLLRPPRHWCPPLQAKAWLSTKQFAEEVRMLVEDAGIKGIKGVPCTVINNTWVIQGAQIADTFFAVRNRTPPAPLYYDGSDYLLSWPFSFPPH
jgi:hypothetical protein